MSPLSVSVLGAPWVRSCFVFDGNADADIMGGWITRLTPRASGREYKYYLKRLEVIRNVSGGGTASGLLVSTAEFDG
jgi:hypothetical protein